MNTNRISNEKLLLRWIRLRQEGITIETLLQERGINEIAIYGYNGFSESLIYELEKSNIEVKCLIDRKGNKILMNFPCIEPCAVGEVDVQAIVVNPVDKYETIIEQLREEYKGNIITIEELLYEL